jgi:hypothetical protein
LPRATELRLVTEKLGVAGLSSSLMTNACESWHEMRTRDKPWCESSIAWNPADFSWMTPVPKRATVNPNLLDITICTRHISFACPMGIFHWEMDQDVTQLMPFINLVSFSVESLALRWEEAVPNMSLCGS